MSNKANNHKAKQINPIQFIRIGYDGYRFILDKLKNRPHTVKQIIESTKIVSRDFIYERVRELERLGYIQKTGRVQHQTRKFKMQGNFFELTESGEFILFLKGLSDLISNKKTQPAGLRYAVF